MTLETRRYVIAVLGGIFLISLLLVQWMETVRRAEVAGLREPTISVPASSQECVECHGKTNPGIIAQWKGSPHAAKGVGCFDCHKADEHEVDGYPHHRTHIATVVTPLDCSRCHEVQAEEFAWSRHAASGEIYASVQFALAERLEGARMDFAPHAPTPGRSVESVRGSASALSGCKHCHGSQIAFQSIEGGMVSVDDLALDESGRPTNDEAVARILRTEEGRPLLHPGTWPNTGMGRRNFDGSRGSCSACHSRHDFSPRRARQPEACGKCHLGPGHAQREIYEESTHAIAYRDRKDRMNLDHENWVLGEDYVAAPTCATCHLSGNKNNGGKVTHDPRDRISWSNQPPVSLVVDTSSDHEIVTEHDPELRLALVADAAEEKRYRMKEVCTHCHTVDYVNWFYSQYDNLVILYNEKFARSGLKIMNALPENGLLTETPFDEQIEWTWFYLWHDAGRQARHGAAMMAPQHSHRYGMREVAESFYTELVPQARALADRASAAGRRTQAAAVRATLHEILSRPEHQWGEKDTETALMPAVEAATGNPRTAP